MCMSSAEGGAAECMYGYYRQVVCKRIELHFLGISTGCGLLLDTWTAIGTSL